MKYCRTCKIYKQISEFGKRTASIDGLSSKCKICQSLYDKTRSNLPKRVNARLQYAQTEKGKSAGNRAKKAWEARNAIKKGASTIVNNSIRDGRIIKSNNCESCGISNVHIQGHHDDYAKPLEVRWLCPKCHTAWHKANGPGLNG
ncbi:hypothetical protein [uncultured Paraglaciecola sp.]|uniref:hypothetical protein n=1 Tax=uncultured Paraglaciecola sp. TaxID=1765024 RepID=UPI0026179C88|nr:hypothetical protein [uncultured Paraglaciecola sp.]